MDPGRTAASALNRLRRLGVRDRRGAAVDLAPTDKLLQRIIVALQPEQIWLFGSRARGDATPLSDWDLLVVLPNDSSEDLFDPLLSWRLRKDSGVRADVVPCRAR